MSLGDYTYPINVQVTVAPGWPGACHLGLPRILG
jgi:hypothetical protein